MPPFRRAAAASARIAVKRLLRAPPDVADVASPQRLQAGVGARLGDGERCPAVQAGLSGRPGVPSVEDHGEYIDRLFSMLGGIRNLTFLIALVQALAAVLLISNMIQISAYTRRTEVGIMRLVGASNFYIQLPFILEAAIAGLIGAAVACGGVAMIKVFFIDRGMAPSFRFIDAWVGWPEILAVMPWRLGARGRMLAGGLEEADLVGREVAGSERGAEALAVCTGSEG